MVPGVVPTFTVAVTTPDASVFAFAGVTLASVPGWLRMFNVQEWLARRVPLTSSSVAVTVTLWPAVAVVCDAATVRFPEGVGYCARAMPLFDMAIRSRTAMAVPRDMILRMSTFPSLVPERAWLASHYSGQRSGR
jgi:hypothetical protein